MDGTSCSRPEPSCLRERQLSMPAHACLLSLFFPAHVACEDRKIPTLSEMRATEGDSQRESRLRRTFAALKSSLTDTNKDPSVYENELWQLMVGGDDIPGNFVDNAVRDGPTPSASADNDVPPSKGDVSVSPQEHDRIRQDPRMSLRPLQSGSDAAPAGPDAQARGDKAPWEAFRTYADNKETELWRRFKEMQPHGGDNPKVTPQQVTDACIQAGVEARPEAIHEFARNLDKDGKGITFEKFRDYFLLLPRTLTWNEAFKYWQTHRIYRPSMSELTPDLDVQMGRGVTSSNRLLGSEAIKHEGEEDSGDFEVDEERKRLQKASNVIPRARLIQPWIDAFKFLLAGGIAGAVSRTATAPLDWLKVQLITSISTRPHGGLGAALRRVSRSNKGIRTLWVGNGLNVLKIVPESAIKFLVYESSKRVFARYIDQVPDQSMISNSSRFISGGLGGVVSQFLIYPLETVKTRVMTSTNGNLTGHRLLSRVLHDMWIQGGVRVYFKGLTAGLIGVFPYSAIDMSSFEGIKLAYTQWTGREPSVYYNLFFGGMSGAIGAFSVYPLNLIRTRLQAQGTPAHPFRYTGFTDAAYSCYRREGWTGFYRGLVPTIIKVAPAVAISYTVYDTSKRFLFSLDDI